MKTVNYIKKNYTEHAENCIYFNENNAKQIYKPLAIAVDWLNALIAYKMSPADEPAVIDHQVDLG